MKQLLLFSCILSSLLFSQRSFAQNTSPNAVNDYVVICENSGTINVAVQSNDTDPENNALTTSIFALPLNGTASLAGNTIDYTPAHNFNGNDTIVYVVCDNGSPSMCDTALVVITVQPAPIADAESDETICLLDSIGIGTPGAMGVTYAWTPAAGLSSTTAAQPMASPSVTTTYILTATNSSTGCQQMDTAIITVNPLPVANAGLDHTGCEGDSVMLGTPGVAGNTYYWSPIIPLNWNSLPQPMAAPNTTTTFTLTVTTTATGCQNKDSVLVTINPAPVTDAGPDVVICNGDSVQLGSPAIAGNTYSWSPATGLSSTTVAQPMASPSVTTTYTLTVSNSSTGCNDTNQVTVSVGLGPVANAGPDQHVCDGDSVMIGTAAIAGNTYSWSPATGLSSSTIAQPNASPVTTTTYTLTVTSASSSCTSTDVVVVRSGTTPVANAGPDEQLCAGGSVSIGSPATAGNSYSWSPATGLSSSTAAQPVASPGVTTTYILTVTQTASGCQAMDTVIVTVHPLPVANAGPDITSCNGDSVQIGTPAIAGNTYSWSPVTGLSSSTVAQPMADPLVTTSYTLTVTNTTTGCQRTDVVVVSVGSAPPADAGIDRSICRGDSTQLGTPGLPGNTYSWSPLTGLSSSTVAQPMASPSVTTTYILTLTNTASGCQTTDAVIVTVNPLPVVNAGPDQVACDGDSVQLGTPAVAGYTYVWLPPLGLSSAVVAQPMASPLVSTTYTLTVSNGLTGCVNMDTVTVNVGTSPVANAGADQSACANDSVQIGTPAVVGLTYSWSPATGLSSSTSAQPMASPALTTTYVITATNATGCSGTDTVIVTVNPLPVANAGADQGVCPGDSAQIGSTASAGFTYSWTPVNGLSSSTSAQPMASPASTTTYILTITNSSTGCTNTDSVVVNVLQPPVANAGPDTSVCAGESVAIGAPSVTGNTYSWSPANGLSSTNVAQPNASPNTTTTYIVTVSNGTTGCHSTDTVVVSVNPAPVASVGNGGSICNGNSITLGAAPVTGYTYSWTPVTGLSSSTSSETTATPSATTTYTLTVTNGGCSSSATVTVTVNTPVVNAGDDQTSCSGGTILLGSPAVAGYTYLWTPASGLSSAYVAQPVANPTSTMNYTLTVTDTASGCTSNDVVLYSVEGGDVYNAFSPNGDGQNDWWNVPLLNCYPENKVIIVNRWGSEVWRADNYNNTDVRWNGQNNNGVDVTDGTYYYIITYNNTEQRGWIFIKR